MVREAWEHRPRAMPQNEHTTAGNGQEPTGNSRKPPDCRELQGTGASDGGQPSAHSSISKSESVTQGICEEQAQQAAETMFAYLRDVLYEPNSAQFDPKDIVEPFRNLARGLLYVGKSAIDARKLAADIARGKLDGHTVEKDNELAAGLKNLQSTLKHITWQMRQVAKGDYRQRVSYSGEFSDAINDMIQQLRERDEALRAEVELNKSMAGELQQSLDLLKSIFATMREWIIVVDRKTKQWLYANHDAAEVLICSDCCHSNLLEFIDSRLAQDAQENAEIIMLEGAHKGLGQHFRSRNYPLVWHGKESMAFVLADITEEVHEREQLETIAYYDTLTGSFSRHYGMLLLDRWLMANYEFILVFVDMDGLKFVNDTLGHNEGDEYIRTVAKALNRFDPEAVVCRLGGDEFMLLCRNVAASEARQRLKELRAELAVDSGAVYTRSISFGLVEVSSDNKKNASLLLSIADENMYHDKRSRKMERRSTL
ncbi:MAG: diguanylate cyclase [Coriobacteriales bacterium]|jgi:diguanylate cyclase (GGDEF)-like protein|nr:diguanylate cyclase [Coriobacteriales bacterium]